MSYRSKLSRRQETQAALFPQRAAGHQLGLGPAFAPRRRHCLGCGHVLGVVEQTCRTCAAFVCRECDELTTRNGGDGHICYGCMRSSA